MQENTTLTVAQVAPPAAPTDKASKDGLLLALQAKGTLEVLDIYRALSDLESQRVWNFVQDAKQRDAQPEEAEAYAALETFRLFVDACREGEPVETTCQWQDLTPAQYDRYARAWESIQAVHEEVRAAFLAKYGPMEGAAPE